MARFFEGSFPSEAVGVLIQEAKAKRFTSVAAGDATFKIGGELNALRPEGDGPVMFGAGGDAKPVAVPKTPAQAVKLAERIEREGQSFGAAGDEAGGAGGALVFALLQFFLERLLKRK